MGFDLAAIRFHPKSRCTRYLGFFKVEWSEGDISKTIIFKGWRLASQDHPGPTFSAGISWLRSAENMFFLVLSRSLFLAEVEMCRFGFPAKLKTKASYFVEIRFLLALRCWGKQNLASLLRKIDPTITTLKSLGPWLGLGPVASFFFFNSSVDISPVGRTYGIMMSSGWWFQIFFIFIPTWGNDPI